MRARRGFFVLACAIVVVSISLVLSMAYWMMRSKVSPSADGPGEPVDFAALPGFAMDDHAAAFAVFRASCAAPSAMRTALPKPPALAAICAEALALNPDEAQARAFFEAHFTPRRIGAKGGAFVTGYYEPLIEGSLTKTEGFFAPLYARPPDLIGAVPGKPFPGLDPSLNAARRLPDGTVTPMPDRAAIDDGALAKSPFAMPPLVYLRDPVEAFFVQVQGSARIKLTDGSLRRLVYAGRNGYPYTSIGKILVDTLHIPPSSMGMTALKDWIRANGQGPGDAGTALMEKNRSYIFFAFDDTLGANAGPIGGEGISLTALRSLAIDRTQWPYGLPFYVDASLPWKTDDATPFQRLFIGQDTGSAILGPARGDIFFGTGDEAARRAGAIRDHGTLFVLWPKAS